MKKLLLVLTVFLCCSSLMGCDRILSSLAPESPTERVTEQDNSIELTMDNYKKYLDLTGISIDEEGDYNYCRDYTGSSTKEITGYREILFRAQTEGVSPNILYNNVILTIRFTGSYYAFGNFLANDQTYELRTFEFDLPVETNVAGGGEAVYLLEISSEETKDWYKYTNKTFFEVTAEVVAVSGSVTPVVK